MKWRVEFRPEVEQDMAEAAAWYETRQPGLGANFIDEVSRIWDALAENPMLNCRRHANRNIRWRYPDRFPYRIIYEVLESEKKVVVAAVLHAARQDANGRQDCKKDRTYAAGFKDAFCLERLSFTQTFLFRNLADLCPGSFCARPMDGGFHLYLLITWRRSFAQDVIVPSFGSGGITIHWPVAVYIADFQSGVNVIQSEFSSV